MIRWLEQTCDTLPSAGSAAALVRGEPQALPKVLLHTAGRAVLIGIGLAIVGEREHLMRNALAGALAVEAFVLAYLWRFGGEA
jgi:hypothetical protein